MRTEEFIKKVNELSEEERGGVKAYLTATNLPAISDASDKWTLASLPCDTKSWEFTSIRSNFPGCVLKLMAEIADSEYRERQKQYVILNGKPYRDIVGNQLFDCFLINPLGFLETDNGVSLSDLTTYTKPELNGLKFDMPLTMQAAIDALTVPLEEALKMGEDDE